MEKILLTEFKKRCAAYSTFILMPDIQESSPTIYKIVLVMLCPNRICLKNGSDCRCIEGVKYIEWHGVKEPWFEIVAKHLDLETESRYKVKIL